MSVISRRDAPVRARWSVAAAAASLAIGAPFAAAGDSQLLAREHEGKWFVSDDTDNNTGERNVYAFAWNLKPGPSDWVTLTMRCSGGKPTFFVDWHNVSFPDETVLSIYSDTGPDSPTDTSFVFEKSEDPVESGLRASPETSAHIIAAIGASDIITVSAHLSSGNLSAVIETTGTKGAWSRVSRHCPTQKMPVPPL